MEYLGAFLTVALVHFLAVASPGPDFAIVIRNSLVHGRRAGVFTALGVGLGILVHVTYCMLGVGLIISQSILLFTVFKFLAAGYLMYVGWQALKAQPVQVEDRPEHRASMAAGKAFQQGFVTNALNPKATLFFLSLFTVMIDPGTPAAVQMGFGVYMAVATTVWFSLVARVFSLQSLRRKLAGVQHWFERVMGGVLILLGLKIATSKLN